MTISSIFQLINNDRSKFNLASARELMKEMTTRENLHQVANEMKLLFEYHQQHKDEHDFPEHDFYQAYNYLQVCPLLKDLVPIIKMDHTIPSLNTTNQNWLILKKLCDEEKTITQKILELSQEIQSLESNKRQPLELFSLRDEYRNLRQKERENLREQSFIANKLLISSLGKRRDQDLM